MLKTDYYQFPPVIVRILLYISNEMKYPFAKIDFTSAFLQTDNAKRMSML